MDDRKHVNYDSLAATYHQRYIHNENKDVAKALRALAEETGAERILEAGCGTGRWLSEFSMPGRNVCGLDLSAGMLSQARQRNPDLCLVRGRSEILPFPPGRFDLVYCVNAIHHFVDAGAFIQEARRVLRPGGGLAVINMSPHRGRNRWFVYDYFNGTLEADLRRFPRWGTVLDWMLAAGFERVEWKVAEHIDNPKVGAAIFDDEFLQKHACSQLALLSDEAYQAGIDHMRQAVAHQEDLIFHVDIELDVLAGFLGS